jgi:hypothetical protein
LQMNTRHQNSAIISLSFFSLSFRLFNKFLHIIFLFFLLVGFGLTRTSMVFPFLSAWLFALWSASWSTSSLFLFLRSY